MIILVSQEILRFALREETSVSFCLIIILEYNQTLLYDSQVRTKEDYSQDSMMEKRSVIVAQYH